MKKLLVLNQLNMKIKRNLIFEIRKAGIILNIKNTD